MVAIPTATRVADMPKGEPVPEAVYYLRVDKATYKTTGKNAKTPGAPMAECELTIFGPAEQEEFVGRKLFENFMLSGEGLFRTRNFLEAGGKDEDFTLEDTDQLVGIEVAAAVQVEPERTAPSGEKYSPRNRVKKYFAIP